MTLQLARQHVRRPADIIKAMLQGFGRHHRTKIAQIIRAGNENPAEAGLGISNLHLLHLLPRQKAVFEAFHYDEWSVQWTCKTVAYSSGFPGSQED